jgi:Zn-finger protein
MDPRCPNYYIYKCGICGEEKEFFWVARFDTTQLRKCSNCGVTNDVDQVESLIKKKQELEQKIASLQAEHSLISSRLEEALQLRDQCKEKKCSP